MTERSRATVAKERIAWVDMTREHLMAMFKTEGGLSGSLWNHFVSVDCPYFKVDADRSGSICMSDPCAAEVATEGT